MGPTEFRNLVSGRSRGVLPAASRAVLRAAEVPYTVAVNWRNRRFDSRHSKSHCAGVPVISVGNLTLGGTGKTPLVKWLTRWLDRHGIRVAIVSRGYGASAGKHNDEALELAQSLPHIPHLQDPHRLAAARRAVDEFSCQAIVLDDGFQHRRLARDLDIVLIDALEPFGFEHVFPRGTLREPACGLRRAHVVCLSRADVIGAEQREAIRRRAAELSPQAAWCELVHAPNQLINSAGETAPLESLSGKRVAVFCAIGNPAGFRHTLEATECEIASWREFPDHHQYGQADIAGLSEMAVSCRASAAVCTQKDLVKIGQRELGGLPLWALAIEMEFQSGELAMKSALEGVLKQA